MKRTSHSAGFSLIELMIVVSIIIITSSIAVPSFKAWIQNTQIRTAAESIHSGLQKARTEALKRNTNIFFRLGANSAWTVGCVTVVTTDADGDGIQDCPAIIDQRSSGEGSSSNITIIKDPPTATDVVFTNLGIKSSTAANQLTSVAVDMSTSIMAASDSRELNVTISSGGEARTCDPNATDARHC
jgi:type IV fimbrial biogenesis protein FimT